MALASNLVQIGLNSKEADFLGDTYTGALTALGITQGTAAPLVSNITRVTTATGGVNDGVILPTLIQAKNSVYVVYNVTGATINIYPGVGDNINELAANTAITLATGNTLLLIAGGTNRWISK